MTSLPDALLKLKNSLRSGPSEQEALASRLIPVVLLEDFTKQFTTTQRAARPWIFGQFYGTPVNVNQVQVQVPLGIRVVTELIAMHVGTKDDVTLRAHFRARGAAALGTIEVAQFRDRRGAVVTSTGIEAATVISSEDAAEVAASDVGSWRLDGGSSSIVYPLGIVLGENDVWHIEQVGIAQLAITILGIERPQDDD